jgi:hypothetical protein
VTSTISANRKVVATVDAVMVAATEVIVRVNVVKVTSVATAKVNDALIVTVEAIIEAITVVSVVIIDAAKLNP